MARGLTCGVHSHASLVPIEAHHIRPKSRGGRDVTTNMIPLCANGHGDVHYLLDEVEDSGGWDVVPWAVMRSFGLKVRAVARLGWNSYAADFMAGRLDAEVRAYRTSGVPRD